MILLGGVKEDGDYSERSLALFYHKFFGARISNLQEYLISQKGGVTSQVTAIVEESEFMRFVHTSDKYKRFPGVEELMTVFPLIFIPFRVQ